MTHFQNSVQDKREDLQMCMDANPNIPGGFETIPRLGFKGLTRPNNPRVYYAFEMREEKASIDSGPLIWGRLRAFL